MNTKKVLLLFGGISTEHEVSCVSAASVLSHMDPDKYRVFCVGISKAGSWRLCPNDPELIRSGEWEKMEDLPMACLLPDSSVGGIGIIGPDRTVSFEPIDCVFPVLHGIGGEDGTVQGICRLARIPCVGSDVASSALCMDKAFAKSVAAEAGIPQARWLVLSPETSRTDEQTVSLIENRFEYPVFIKPANAGSSVGISKVKSRAELLPAIREAASVDPKVIVEENIVGKEVEVAVLGNEELFASIVGEIAPADGFYSYSSKYEDDTAGLYIPARLDPSVAEKVRREALRAYRALGCRGFSRVDFFVASEERVIFNEVNTIPGFTSISMYPKLMEASGIAFNELVDKLIALALE